MRLIYKNKEYDIDNNFIIIVTEDCILIDNGAEIFNLEHIIDGREAVCDNGFKHNPQAALSATGRREIK